MRSLSSFKFFLVCSSFHQCRLSPVLCGALYSYISQITQLRFIPEDGRFRLPKPVVYIIFEFFLVLSICLFKQYTRFSLQQCGCKRGSGLLQGLQSQFYCTLTVSRYEIFGGEVQKKRMHKKYDIDTLPRKSGSLYFQNCRTPQQHYSFLAFELS